MSVLSAGRTDRTRRGLSSLAKLVTGRRALDLLDQRAQASGLARSGRPAPASTGPEEAEASPASSPEPTSRRAEPTHERALIRELDRPKDDHPLPHLQRAQGSIADNLRRGRQPREGARRCWTTSWSAKSTPRKRAFAACHSRYPRGAPPVRLSLSQGYPNRKGRHAGRACSTTMA